MGERGGFCVYCYSHISLSFSAPYFTTSNDGMCVFFLLSFSLFFLFCFSGGVTSLFIWNVPFSCFWNATSQFPRLKASYHHSYVLLKVEKDTQKNGDRSKAERTTTTTTRRKK